MKAPWSARCLLLVAAVVHSTHAWMTAVGAWGGFSPGARTLGLRSARPAGRRALRCAATGDASEFSSVAAWEAEYEALKNTKTIKAGNPVQEGGNLLTKALPGLAVIGNAVERAINKDSDPQQRAMSESQLAKEGEKQTDPPPMDGYRIVNTYDHTKESFTQGIYWDAEEQLMFEGSGGASFSHGTRIAKIDLATCTTTAFRSLPNRYFGEGITVVGDRLYQLTWTSNVGFVYDKRSFELLGQFEYDHPGWGLTNDGTSLIVSDGSPYLYFYNPETFVQERKLLVRYLGRKSGEMTPLRRINDLQFVKGKIYANIWETERLAVIDPDSGLVERFIELKGLLDRDDPWIQKWSKSDACLNGIAYDEANDRLFVTGKMWTRLFEIEVVAGANLNVEEAAAKVLPKDYGNSQLGGFDPLGLGT